MPPRLPVTEGMVVASPQSLAPVVSNAAQQPPLAEAALPATDVTTLLTTLAAMRAEGGHQLDPVRFRYLESLAGRLETAPKDVSGLLQGKLGQAVAEYRARQTRQAPATPTTQVGGASAPSPARPFAAVYARRRAAASGGLLVASGAAPAGEPPVSPLAALNRYIRLAARHGVGESPLVSGEVGQGPGESAAAAPGTSPQSVGDGQRQTLKSARRFSETWSKLQSAQLVDKALQRAPENAGPFNPHRLMVRAMVTMRDLSPDCLHRFMLHADALLKLEQIIAQHQTVPGKSKPAKPVRTRK
jgi:hypothetical protein